MKIAHQTLTFELQPGETAPLSVAQDAFLAVHDAVVWLTREGEPRDHFLHDGDTLGVHAKDSLWLSNAGQRPATVELKSAGTPVSTLAYRAAPRPWLPWARGTHEGAGRF